MIAYRPSLGEGRGGSGTRGGSSSSASAGIFAGGTGGTAERSPDSHRGSLSPEVRYAVSYAAVFRRVYDTPAGFAGPPGVVGDAGLGGGELGLALGGGGGGGGDERLPCRPSSDSSIRWLRSRLSLTSRSIFLKSSSGTARPL
jgi:hypothetical protein